MAVSGANSLMPRPFADGYRACARDPGSDCRKDKPAGRDGFAHRCLQSVGQPPGLLKITALAGPVHAGAG